MKLPEGHQTVMPYLVIDKAGQFLEFVKVAFNATEKMIVPTPSGGIMHGEVMIGMSTIMFAGATEQYKPMPVNLYIYVEDVDKTYLRALKAGATMVRKPRQEEYGYSGGVADMSGNTWWLTAPDSSKK